MDEISPQQISYFEIHTQSHNHKMQIVIIILTSVHKNHVIARSKIALHINLQDIRRDSSNSPKLYSMLNKKGQIGNKNYNATSNCFIGHNKTLHIIHEQIFFNCLIRCKLSLMTFLMTGVIDETWTVLQFGMQVVYSLIDMIICSLNHLIQLILSNEVIT